MSTTYLASRILAGDSENIRQHSFTRWMSRDLMQAAADFCRNIGLFPIYAETSPERLTRYLFWKPPEGARFELRTGRTLEQFKAFDAANAERGWPLLTLHINECDIYSAHWISPGHYHAAGDVLATYGITAASRRTAV